MNKQELIKHYESLLDYDIFDDKKKNLYEEFVKQLKQLDELETDHAEESPKYVKNIIARLRELPSHNRAVWLKVIMSEFEKDFSLAKHREGYEQGKFDGMIEREKVKVPQFVADWYEKNKDDFETSLFNVIYEIFKKRNDNELREFEDWVIDNYTEPFKTIVNMHQFGYEVEREKRYLVKVKNIHSYSSMLKRDDITREYFFGNELQMCASSSTHTRKELEEAGFGEVFNSPLFEVEEVEG